MAEADLERSWLERELLESREREAHYRERLGEQEAAAERLARATDALYRLFQRRPPSHDDLRRTLEDVARISAQALQVQRGSVWLFETGQTSLRCVIQLIEGAGVAVEETNLDCADYPRYVQVLREEGILAVRDVYDDVRTTELLPYLRERNIHALLDIPIAIPGGLLGIVCHEHVGEVRRWERHELAFAANVGHMIALALETERRMGAELTARSTEAKYQHLVESLPVTVYSFDVHTGKLDYLSPRIFELGGWSVQEWLAEGVDAWLARIHPDDRAPVMLRFEKGTAGGFQQEVTYRVLLPDGRTHWVRDSCRVIRDHAGLPLALQGLLADVTEQTEAQLSRTEFERRYRTLIENVDLFAVTLDTHGNVVFANDAFLRLSGFSRGELIGQNWFGAVLPPETRESVRQRFLDDVTNGTIVARFELTIVTRKGESRLLLCSNTLLRGIDGSAQGTASLAIDITDRRRLESELLQQTKLESLERLAGSVAHDFNNLLTVMMNETTLLREGGAGTGASEPHFEALDQALDQAAELANSLLLYGGKQAKSAETFVLDEMVRGAQPLLEAIVGRELALTMSLNAGVAQLTLDRTQLRQVLANLVGNAADATRGHGKGIHITSHIESVDDARARAKGASRGGDFVVLSVADDGRGIEPQTLARIFDPFFTTKADGRGTGLGLAITQTIVSQAGGFVTVDSVAAEGSTFRVYLPLRGRHGTNRPSQRVRALSTPTQLEGKRVLLVEDLTLIRELVATQLRDAGFDVIAVGSCRAAMEVLGSSTVDLLLTDMHLPDGSGNALAKSARSVHRNLRILLMSGSTDIDSTFDGLLAKPFDEVRLLAAIRQAFGDKGQGSAS